MSTVNTNDRTSATANGLAPIPFDFQALSADEIAVLRANVPQFGTYTVSINGDGTGSIQPSSDWGTDTITIFSDPTFEQRFEFTRFAPFYPDQVTAALDRLARTSISLKNRFDVAAPDATLRNDLAALGGDALVRAQRAETGAVARSVQSKLRDVAHAKDFGIIGDASDETTKLTAFFNSAIANPGYAHILPPARYGFSVPMPTINVSHVWIEGAHPSFHDGGTGNQSSGAVLVWLGGAAPGSTGLKIEPVSNVASQRLTGVRVDGLSIDCNNGALGTGLSIKSAWECDVYAGVANASNTGFYLGCVAALGEARDLQSNRLLLRSRQIEANGYGLTADGLNVGSNAANTSTNDIHFKGQIANQAAINAIDSDNNRWIIEAFKAPGTATVGMYLRGGAVGAGRARAEHIELYSCALPIDVGGTDTYAVASTGSHVRLDTENATPAPTIHVGGDIAVKNADIGYTPVLSASGGSVTASAIKGRYRRLEGNLIHFEINFTIGTDTGTGQLRVTLPTAVNAGYATGADVMERSGTGKVFYGDIAPAGTYVTILDAGAYPGGAGRVFSVSGTYRAA